MRRICLTFLATLIFFLVACGRAPLHHQESFVFGTRVELLIAGLDEAQARPAAAAVLREFDRLHRTYHAWQPSAPVSYTHLDVYKRQVSNLLS